MLRLFLFLTIFVSLNAYSRGYFLGQAGYGQLNQQAVASNNIHPSGITYGVGGGIREEYIELEGIISKINLAGDIEHDGVGNTLQHEQTSFILALNFYLHKRIYLRFGYSFNRIDQYLENEVSKASMEGARHAYDMQENVNADGVALGGGVVVYDSGKMDIFTQFESLNMPTAKANIWNGSLGFRFHFR